MSEPHRQGLMHARYIDRKRKHELRSMNKTLAKSIYTRNPSADGKHGMSVGSSEGPSEKYGIQCTDKSMHPKVSHCNSLRDVWTFTTPAIVNASIKI